MILLPVIQSSLTAKVQHAGGLLLLKRVCLNHSSITGQTASSAGCISTGNAGRDYNLISDQTETRIIPSNFVLESGRVSLDSLLQRLGDGLYIFESYDMFHSLNPASGDFTIPCAGILYSEGRPSGKIMGISMSGNIMDLFLNIEEVAEDYASLSMVMSKSFQVASSSVLVSSLNITGE